MFVYHIKSKKVLAITCLVLGLFLSGIANAQVSKNVWMYLYNSDGSKPASGDISIRVYLQKNPSDVSKASNTKNGLLYEINNKWGFFPNSTEGSKTNAKIGDLIVIECENTSGGAHHGERKVLTTTLDGNMWQQLGDDNISLMMEMTEFYAKVHFGVVELHWTTETETKNMGFNIFRSDAGKQEFVKINESIIPCPGTTGKQNKYSFADKTAEFGKTYMYKIQGVDSDGSTRFYTPLLVHINSQQTPENFELFQNFPNPFNPETTINYNLPSKEHVTLIVYNTLGEIVRELVHGDQQAGNYTVTWDGLSDAGTQVSTGLYLYQFQAGGVTQVRKMTLTK